MEVRVFIFSRKQQGFSLVEALIVIFMVVILTVGIVPFFQTYVAQNRVKGATETLANNIYLARSIAIQKATPTTLIFNISNWCYGMSSGVIACDCTSAASSSNCNLGIVSGTDYPNTTLTNTFTSNTITFSATRGTTNSGTATFIAGAYSAQVSVNTMGTASTCSSGGTVGGYIAC
ncbi:MAG: hypothetical protein A3E53_03455 [Gammaproteobacteria bacterium RIFCSPHIGHO2_12_FULL_39_24]|nr:MAG: hypothetical protein A3E53_03455 [Gammaproteobacteria bacterium RIFCSPHIGHO2_12_FULL_39_24]